MRHGRHSNCSLLGGVELGPAWAGKLLYKGQGPARRPVRAVRIMANKLNGKLNGKREREKTHKDYLCALHKYYFTISVKK